jgi:hypothetical protein
MVDMVETKFKLQNTINPNKFIDLSGLVTGLSMDYQRSTSEASLNISIYAKIPDELINVFRHINRDPNPWVIISEDFELGPNCFVRKIGPDSLFVKPLSMNLMSTLYRQCASYDTVSFEIASWDGINQSYRLLHDHIRTLDGSYDDDVRITSLTDGKSAEIHPDGSVIIFTKDKSSSYRTNVNEIIELLAKGI